MDINVAGGDWVSEWGWWVSGDGMGGGGLSGCWGWCGWR